MILKGKVAIVTGASKGIGKAVALALAREGVNLAVSARNQGLLEQAAGEFRQAGVQCLTFQGDMSKEQEIQNFIRTAAGEFGHIDILVNNAGLGYFLPLTELSTQQWDEMFNLNIRGLFIATRECLSYLRQVKESVIVNVASLAGKNAFVNGSGYAATKHAVIGFSRCLMLEERKNGVRVLVICPGSVDTNFSTNSSDKPDGKQEKILMPEDVADSIIHMIRLPQRAMVSEIDIRPTNPA